MASRLLCRIPASLIKKPSHSVSVPTVISRTMASSAPRKFEWLVVVPDKPNMLAKRLEVRPTHFANLKDKLEAGVFKMGGALLDEVPEDDDASKFKFNGSTLVCIAETKQEIVDMLKKDVYAESGVWDVENAQIWPFKCAFRHP